MEEMAEHQQRHKRFFLCGQEQQVVKRPIDKQGNKRTGDDGK